MTDTDFIRIDRFHCESIKRLYDPQRISEYPSSEVYEASCPVCEFRGTAMVPLDTKGGSFFECPECGGQGQLIRG